jgi:hypothetical protein
MAAANKAAQREVAAGAPDNIKTGIHDQYASTFVDRLY